LRIRLQPPVHRKRDQIACSFVFGHSLKEVRSTGKSGVDSFDEQVGVPECISDAARVHGIFRVSRVADQRPTETIRTPEVIGEIRRSVKALDAPTTADPLRNFNGQLQRG
jgi:hypothetical protein